MKHDWELADEALSTGFADLDRALAGGLYPGNRIAIAGPAEIVQAVQESILFHLAGNYRGILHFTGNASAVIARHARHLAFGVEPVANLGEDQVRHLIKAYDYSATLPYVIDDRTDQNSVDMGYAANNANDAFVRSRMGYRLHVIAVSDLRDMKPTRRYEADREHEIAQVVADLHAMARQHEAVVIAALPTDAQGVDDLGEYDSVAHGFDVVLMPRISQATDRIEITVEKFRHGAPLGTAECDNWPELGIVRQHGENQ